MHHRSRHLGAPTNRALPLGSMALVARLSSRLLRPLGTRRALAPALAIVGVVALSGTPVNLTAAATTTTTDSATAAQAAPGVLPFGSAPSWRDEFDAASLSTTKWNVHNNSSVSYDNSVSYASQATTSAGILRLRAERMTPITHGGKTRSWKSAHLTTVGKFTQRYGRWEMRAKLPNTSGNSAGLWPSFWLRDSSGPGEVDIFEAWGTPTIRTVEDKYLNENVTSTIHQDTYGGKAKTKFQWLPPQSTATPTRLSGGYHTYVCEWTPQGFKFFLDGVKVGERLTANFPWFTTSFPGKVNMRIHYAVGQGYYGQPTAATKSPADYLIDYVRVYPYTG